MLVGMAVIVSVATAAIHHDRQEIKKANAVANHDFNVKHRPRCYGPASRDTAHPCNNPALATKVEPTPAAAANQTNGPCKKGDTVDLVTTCDFGASPKTARRQFALIGDSHAAHWRAGLIVVAKALQWRGITLARTSCALSTATKDLVEPIKSQCVKWNKEVPEYLAKHPEITIAIISEHNGGGVIAPKGVPQFTAEVHGYEHAWQQLPKTIKHIIVIRDDPHMLGTTMRCVEAAIGNHVDAGEKCKVKRNEALRPDPAAVAAKHITGRHVQLIDLTRLLCSPAYCYPVIGGVLVYKDIHHYSRFESTLLGPYALARIRKFVHSWRPNPHAEDRDRVSRASVT